MPTCHFQNVAWYDAVLEYHYLFENYRDIPNSIISAVIEANIKRKSFIVSNILSKNINVIGVYKLAMKKDSDNFRESAVIDIMMSLISKNIKIILYEPNIQNQIFEGIVNYNNLDEFIKDSDLIIANRVEDEIGHVKEKVYSRDIFHKN